MGKKKKPGAAAATVAVPVDPVVGRWRSAVIALRRQYAALIDQQFWCLGCDIRTDGNLLVRRGFTRYRYADARLCSAYTLPIADRGVLTVWGWGAVLHDDDSGLLLERQHFHPVLIPTVADVYALSTRRPTGSPASPLACQQAAEKLAALAAGMAAHEHWIAAELGLAYRQRTIDGWDKLRRTGFDAAGMAAGWHAIAERCAALHSELHALAA